MRTKILSVILSICLLSTFVACSLPFKLDSGAKTFFKLSAGVADDKVYQTRDYKVVVRDILASGFIDSHRVVFSRVKGEVGYYQFASWVEPPAKAITDGLVLGLDKSKLFKAVSKATSGAVADYQLNAELLEFSHDVSASETFVKIILRAELVDLRTRGVVATKLFELSQPVLSDNVDGAVLSFNLGSQKLVSQFIGWIDSSLPSSTTL
jgi:cholesterol transport system auxiliary component